MKASEAFLVSALVTLALLVATVLALGRVCSGSWSAPAALPQIRVEQIEDLLVRAAFREDAARLVTAQAVTGQPVSGETAPVWWQRFLCDIRISDLALLAGVVFLLLAGIFQGLWMRSALQAAKKSAALADEALVSAQRPYVFLKEVRVSLTKNPISEEIQTCTLQPVWENSGATPTRNGRSHVNWRYFERAVPADFDFADIDDLGNRVLTPDAYRPLVVGPKSTALAPVINIEPAILRQVRDLQGKLLIWGFAEYDEIFPGSPRHRTEFCYQVAVSGSPASHIGFSQYHLHNGMDDECAAPARAAA